MTTPAASATPPIAASEALWERALRVIPTGTQTLSKAPSQFVDGVSPKFLRRGQGSHVWDVDGNEYIDYPMALGPILLGYDHPAVTAAAIAQVREGTTFTLMHPLEVRARRAARRARSLRRARADSPRTARTRRAGRSARRGRSPAASA